MKSGIACELTKTNGIKLTLTCAEDHGLFPARSDAFEGESYMEVYNDAMKAGWKETYINDARQFLCPEHSGKVSP